MRYAYIDSDTQAVVVGSEPPASVSMWWQVPDDEDPNALTVGWDGHLIRTPSKPFPWLEWDEAAEAWFDARTQDELDDERQKARARATMPRTAFCVACARAGIISEDEAIAAAGGAIPPAFAPVIDAMSAADRFEAKVRWAGAVNISRVDPLIIACAAALQMSDDSIDALFGM